jgi:hypothetical protein
MRNTRAHRRWSIGEVYLAKDTKLKRGVAIKGNRRAKPE